MNARNLATIACKALAIYGTLISLSYLTMLVGNIKSIGSPSLYDNQTELIFSVALSIVPYLIQLTFIILLWRNAEFISRKMVPESSDQTPHQLTSDRIYIVAFTVIGLFVLIETVPVLVFHLASLWQTRKFYFRGEQLTERYLPLIVPSLKIILALMLLFGGKGIVKIIAGLRKIIDDRLESRKAANGT